MIHPLLANQDLHVPPRGVRFVRRCSRVRVAVATGLMCFSLGVSPGVAQSTSRSEARPKLALEDHPGFVDLEGISAFNEDNLAIEVNLSDSLMSLLTNSLEDDDSDLAQAISNLRAVNLRVFDLEEDGGLARNVRQETRALSKHLVAEGWDAIVRVRDEGETIEILLRHDEEKVRGLFAMFTEDGESAGFINIVGEVDPSQLARIGRQFNLEPLVALEDALSEDN